MEKIKSNFIIVHGSFGDSKEHYLKWLDQELSKRGNVINLDYPIGKDKQTFENWEKTLLPYKDQITQNTVFIGRSIAPIFIVHFCLKHNLKIKSLISISGFNGFINIPDYDYVNKTFLLDEIDEFKKLCKNIICFYSDNDPYVPYFQLDMFARCLATKKIKVSGAGHFNFDTGYGEKFEDILKYIK